jgi:hypothetical protein
MTSLSKDTLHSVLSKIEEMTLPEGDYLTLCNLLKKQFETIPEPKVPLRVEDLDRTLLFCGKREIKIHITKRTVLRGQATDDLYEYTVNGVSRTESSGEFGKRVSQLMRMNHTKKIVLNDEFETTYSEYKKYAEEMDQIDDEDDDWMDYNPRFAVMHMAGIIWD